IAQWLRAPCARAPRVRILLIPVVTGTTREYSGTTTRRYNTTREVNTESKGTKNIEGHC
ncbi:unnamed protein product, partial [Arabidopsis halleri]